MATTGKWWRLLAVAGTLLCGVGAAAQTPERPILSEAQQQLVNRLAERDRPRDLLQGSFFSNDEKEQKRYEKDGKKFTAIAHEAVAGYRRSRSLADWRKMLDALNRSGALRENELLAGNELIAAFFVLHQLGPPARDPDNGGDAAVAAARHRALMRFLATHVWTWKWTQIEQKRIAAAYLDDCERRPSRESPSGNNLDPNCGFWFHMSYPDRSASDPAWDVNQVPQSLAAFAANLPTVPSTRPWPQIRDFHPYPLVSDPRHPLQLSPGNRAAFARLFAQPYPVDRAERERQAALVRAYDRQKLQELSERHAREETERKALEPRWQALWALASPSHGEQVELEDISFRLNRMDMYRGRFEIVSYDRLSYYCSIGYGRECARKAAIEARDRAAISTGLPGGTPPSATVSVRTYDQHGNYTGTTTTTRIDAELMGARPQ